MTKKLIEVALPLEAINQAAAREKSIRHGHPSTLHLWWARRPLAACRAVLFASLVDDPGEYMPDEEATAERQRLFALIEELVQWENTNNEEVLDRARLEIARSVARSLDVETPVGKAAIRRFLAEQAPPVLDPFAGGGSIPLEAQRLGLRAYASDLNPVAVLINKALIEIPPKFADRPPVHPPEQKIGQKTLLKKEWRGAQGLAEDVRYYGAWMRAEAEKRIGYLYPTVKLPTEQGGGEATVIAWLWARTVACPNPACGARMPLVRSFALSTKKSKQAWVEPVIDHGRRPPAIDFTVKTGQGTPPSPPKIARGAKFQCLVCNQVAPDAHIKAEGMAGRMEAQLMAIVAEGKTGRIYVSPDTAHEQIAMQAQPTWRPDYPLAADPRAIWSPLYGLDTFDKLFTHRQLVALTTFSDLVSEGREQVRRDALAAGLPEDGVRLSQGGRSATAYADAMATYLGMATSRQANRMSTICFWDTGGENVQQMFARQAVPMTWDFTEANPFCSSTGSWLSNFDYIGVNLERLPPDAEQGGVGQADATYSQDTVASPLVSTDPPYYDNIGYADLSDYFYIWLRRSLRETYPDLFGTVLVPKSRELVAAPYRFQGDKELARQFFETGLVQAFQQVYRTTHPNYPVTIYYAFKQTESDDAGTSVSTGWQTMLEGVIQAGFTIVGTWPMRTEQPGGLRVIGQNALTSSIVLACRPRPADAPQTTRRDFLAALQRELAPALRTLQLGNIAPVDLAQAAIGPGMAVCSRYRQVLEADGSPLRVRAALALINQALGEFLAEQEGEYDTDTRWALAWFEQYGHGEGPYGVAETLSKAKNTSPEGLVQAGILEARAGKVRLLRRDELDPDWDPHADRRPTAWEAAHHLIHVLDSQGEGPAAALLARLGGLAEPARDLAYRLYTVCERKGWAQEALGYNMLVVAWPRLKDLVARQPARQESLL